jgi:GDP-L-fucose synthase
LVNIGEDISIIDLAHLVKKIVGFEGEILTDTSKPDDTPRKIMDVSKLADLGWRSSISLEESIGKVYNEVKEYNWS